MIINNKEILQSYILTTAKYDYSVYEKRILYRLVEVFQQFTNGIQLNEKILVKKDLKDVSIITLPISMFLVNEEDKNHHRIKEALRSLENKKYEYEDEQSWQIIRLISEPEILKYEQCVSFRINPKIVEVFLDFSKGFKKYELKVAMQFESVYSMRFYELLSNQKTPINYSIETLKEMFQITDKYKKINDFIKRVIEPSKKELERCSPYAFHYEPIKTGRKITSIRFIPIYQPQFEDESIKRKNLNKQLSNRWFIPKNVEDYLKYNFEFSDKELNNNLNLFESLYNNLSEEKLLDFLAEIREPSSYADNRKAFVIGALKKKGEQLFSEKYL